MESISNRFITLMNGKNGHRFLAESEHSDRTLEGFFFLFVLGLVRSCFAEIYVVKNSIFSNIRLCIRASTLCLFRVDYGCISHINEASCGGDT